MSSKKVLKLIEDKQVEFVDLRFTEPKGKLQHLTMDSTLVDEEMLDKGVFFDGSSIAGWNAINESDMILKPDLEKPIIDPFNSQTSLNIFCDILDAVKKNPYARDPRGTAKKAEAYLKKTGIGDKSYFGPEPEFFVFDEDGEPKSASEKEALSWWSDVEPVLVREWEEETAARHRWLECRNMMRNELACARFEAHVLRKGGDFFKIPVELWLGEKGGVPIRTGSAKFLHSHGYSTFEIEGPVLMRRLFLQREWAEESAGEAQGDPTIDEVRFPYLAFMITAARDAPFSSNGRTSKKTLEGWIRDNWPDELGVATETKITNMATFLRRPEDERGGMHRKGQGQ